MPRVWASPPEAKERLGWESALVRPAGPVRSAGSAPVGSLLLFVRRVPFALLGPPQLRACSFLSGGSRSLGEARLGWEPALVRPAGCVRSAGSDPGSAVEHYHQQDHRQGTYEQDRAEIAV